MKNKLKVYSVKQDPTPYQQWKSEGKSTKDFLMMVITIMVVIPAFVYVAAAVGEPFMKSIYTGPIATAAIFYAFWQLCKVLDGRYK